jgi:hypothetical protein
MLFNIPMIILNSPLSINQIKQEHNHFFETMVKIVVDIEKGIIAIDAELHADLEEYLLEHDSNQKDLWGANLYFDKPDFIEYTALINIRPAQNNKSMEIQDLLIRKKIDEIVKKNITW